MALKTPVLDRIPTYPGRVKLTPVSGQSNTFDMERADQPVVVGTPLNKKLLDQKAYTLTEDVTVYVNGSSGSDDGDGTESSPYATIQAAIDSIPKCLGGFVATVDIAAGSYSERVRIEGFYGGRLVVGQTDRATTTRGISIFSSSTVVLQISNITAEGGDGSTLLYIGYGSNVVVNRHITLACEGAVGIGVGVEQGSTLSTGTVSVNVNGSTEAAILAKGGSMVSLNIAGGSSNTGVGLKAEAGSIIAYTTRSMSATTAQLTVNGGRIYSGAQTAIPNY